MREFIIKITSPGSVGLLFVGVFVLCVAVGFPPAALLFLLFPGAWRRSQAKSGARRLEREHRADVRFANQYK